jgi:Protein tyrosine and serine/threonine kinase/Putative zinc-finger
MKKPHACPNNAQLQHLLAGTLPNTERVEVEQHLEECGACQRTVEGLSGVTGAWIPGGAASVAAGAAAPATETSPPPLSEGLGTLGSYQIVERLDGERGLLLKAFEPRLRRHVAIRLLSPELAGDPEARKRFARTARSAAAIDHDNVITIHAVEEGGPKPFLVMEFVEGASVRERLKRPEKPALKEILRIGQQAAAGVAAIHARGLVHGNVDLGSVMVQDRTGRVILTDVGLGILSGLPPASGSPGQAAEEARRADLVALAGVLFALCTGQEWAEGTDVNRALTATPPWLRDAILALLDEAQPLTAAETADLLRRQLVALQPAPAGARRLLSPAQRKRRRRLAVAIVLLLIFGGFGVSEATRTTRLIAQAAPLVSGRATLTVALEDPEARVSLAGYDLEITEPGTQEISMRPGAYLLRVEREGKPRQEQRITLPWAGREEVTVRAEPPRVRERPFVVRSLRGFREQECLTLAEAVRAARRCDIIEIHGDGPFKSPPVSIGKKPLTIRAATGFRPVIDFEQVAGPGAFFYLSSSGPLVLEGIELRIRGTPKSDSTTTHSVVRVIGAPFHVTHCRIVVIGSGFGLRTHEAPELVVRDSELIRTTNSGNEIIGAGRIPNAGRVDITNSVVVGGAHGLILTRNSPEVRDVSLRLHRNTLSVRCPFLLWHLERDLQAYQGEKETPISIEMTGNVIDSQAQFFRFLLGAYKADEKTVTAKQGEALLKHLVRWQMRDNLLPEGIDLLRCVQGWDQPVPGSLERRTLAEWTTFWGLKETRSLLDRPLFAGVNLADRLANSPEEVTAADFRLQPGSAGQGAGPGGQDLGANVDLVGPGPAYDRWKKTPDYQEWLRKTRPALP